VESFSFVSAEINFILGVTKVCVLKKIVVGCDGVVVVDVIFAMCVTTLSLKKKNNGVVRSRHHSVVFLLLL
ncbi:MAG: hypothetical protein Q4D14_05895, partial [Bacteroidales bacterium]|nr:hypothetical protein [Bacteroidales bacterium]